MTEQPWDPYRDGAESWQDAHVRQAQQPGMRLCIGWARQVGWWHLGARVAALGDGPMAEAMRAGPSPDLHPTWAEVIDKLRGSA